MRMKIRFWTSILSLCCLIFAKSNPPVVDGNIYAFNNVSIISILNPTTGIITPFGPQMHQNTGSVSIDNTNQLLYTVVFNESQSAMQLLGLSLSTGNVVYNIDLKIEYSNSVDTCDVDPSTGDVLVLGASQISTDIFQLIRVTPSKGTIQTIQTYKSWGQYIPGSHCYDWGNEMLWIQFFGSTAIFSYGIDVNTGEVVYNLTQSKTDKAFMQTMDFDPVSGLVYGIGLQVDIENQTSSVVVMTVNSQTGKYDVVGTVHGWGFALGMSGLDTTGRILYTYLQHDLQPFAEPFFVVSIDLSTGKQKSAAAGCYVTDSGFINCANGFKVYNGCC